MSIFVDQFVEQLFATSLLEWLAVTLAVAYLLLAIKESLWCWPAAFFSTAIYVFLFFDVNLYMESFLNVYYLLMAIYGWYQWRGSNTGSSAEDKTTENGLNQKQITTWTLSTHVFVIIITAILVFASAFLLKKYTNQSFALIDSFTTWYAILATYMVTQKKLENWAYWIIIDAVSIYLYTSKGFALTSVLFAIYIILAFAGWHTWKREFEKNSNSTFLASA